MKPMERAVEIIGSQKSLAETIGVTPAFVNQLISGHRPIPAEHCPKIERATGGIVRCEDLRPDVDWAYLRATDCPINNQEAA